MCGEQGLSEEVQVWSGVGLYCLRYPPCRFVLVRNTSLYMARELLTQTRTNHRSDRISEHIRQEMMLDQTG